MKLKHSDVTSIANGRAFDRMALWGLVWSIVWIAVVALIAAFVACPAGCWISFMLLLLWFAGLMYKFLRTSRALRKALFEEIKANPEIELIETAAVKVEEDKHEDI